MEIFPVVLDLFKKKKEGRKVGREGGREEGRGREREGKKRKHLTVKKKLVLVHSTMKNLFITLSSAKDDFRILYYIHVIPTM